MENENIPSQEEGYQPRPRWQVWLARIGLVAFLLFVLLYYLNIFGIHL